MEKTCTKCGLTLDIESFNKKCDSKDGYRTICRECQKAGRNKERESEQFKIWAANNREARNEYAREYHAKHKQPSKRKPYEYAREYRAKHKQPSKRKPPLTKEEKLERQRTYYNNRIKTDPNFKLRVNIKRRILASLKRKNLNKETTTQEILGCSFEDFRTYIEGKFEPWMNWDNYGKYNGEPNFGWDIDHIIPVSSGLTSDDIKALNHYTNLQPLCSYVNRAVKGATLQ